jgi:hypothetical protein
VTHNGAHAAVAHNEIRRPRGAGVPLKMIAVRSGPWLAAWAALAMDIVMHVLLH